MQFSIITPSFRQLPWLKRCIRSVADQQGITLEHIVQDGGSEDELVRWVREQANVRLYVEKDTGMYDALNRGLDKANGEIIGLLNSDEQYLPQTLAKIAREFAARPGADILAGDYLIVDPEQRLLSFRKVTPLRSAMILTDHLYAFTCGLFFRRAVFERGLRFAAELKSVADGELVARALDAGHRAELIGDYLATFTCTGENLSGQAISRREELAVRDRLPRWMRMLAPLLRQWRHVERFWVGGYRSGPIEYDVYLGEEDLQRTRMKCERPSFRFPSQQPVASSRGTDG